MLRHAALVLGLAVLCCPSKAPAAAAGRTGVVAELAGEVRVERAGTPYRVRPGSTVKVGDLIRTGETGKVRLLLEDNSVLSVGPRSRIVLEAFTLAIDEGRRAFDLRVLAGRFKIDIGKWFLGATEGRIQTPTAVVGVRGTVVWGDTDLDAVCALEGRIALAPVSKPEAEIELADGRCVSGMANGETNPLSPSAADLAGFLAEVDIR